MLLTFSRVHLGTCSSYYIKKMIEQMVAGLNLPKKSETEVAYFEDMDETY